MSLKKYDLTLKGYVGGWDFNRADVDDVLKSKDGREVNILIDSTGGSLSTGLSISAAFRIHGNVNVHFVGMNASAATIAALGARHVSMDRGAMYLVHRCSMPFFEWRDLNSEEFQRLIDDCSKIKDDLDKIDRNCAALYAARCKRPVDDLLDLMKVGGWITAEEALEWGFIDEITDLKDDKAPTMTQALARKFAENGIPMPDIAVAEEDRASLFGKFIQSVSALLKPKNFTNYMKKNFKFICTILACESIEFKDSAAAVQEEQLNAIETELAKNDETIKAKDAEIEKLNAKINELNAKLDEKPADSGAKVIENKQEGAGNEAPDSIEAYLSTANSAAKLFNSLP